MTWTYNNESVSDELIGDSYGFVYIITNLQSQRRYIGRKYLTKAAYKTVNGKRKKIRKASDWETYYGSNKVLLEDVKRLGEVNFTRTIMMFGRNRSECAYWETHHIFAMEALLSDSFYNEWVTCKISKKNIKRPGIT